MFDANGVNVDEGVKRQGALSHTHPHVVAVLVYW